MKNDTAVHHVFYNFTILSRLGKAMMCNLDCKTPNQHSIFFLLSSCFPVRYHLSPSHQFTINCSKHYFWLNTVSEAKWFFRLVSSHSYSYGAGYVLSVMFAIKDEGSQTVMPLFHPATPKQGSKCSLHHFLSPPL